jgi:hypothetical protein
MLLPNERSILRAANLTLCLFLIALAAILFQAEVPDASDAVYLWGKRLHESCLIKQITGKPCPTCGLTRAVVLLFDGRFAEARTMHPSALWVGLWITIQIFLRAVFVVRPVSTYRLLIFDMVFSFITFVAAELLPIML